MTLENAEARMTRLFLALLGSMALVMVGLAVVPVPKAAADVKAVETLECDPDNDAIVSAQGPLTLSGSCTSAMVTLDGNHFKLKDAKGPVEIDRHDETAGTGTTHAYYLMIFWQD
jgi:hypothetical protein